MAIDQSHKDSTLRASGKHPWWRSSLYEEPVWVSLAWLVCPMLLAGVTIYFAVR